MITVLFHLTTREGVEPQARALFTDMTRVTRAEGPGCINYTFHQQKKEPRQWVLYEQWRDSAALDDHIANMKKHFGEPRPDQRLPPPLHDLHESYRVYYYDVVA